MKIVYTFCKHLISFIAERVLCTYQQQFSINVRAGTVGDCLVGPHGFATSDYRQPLQRFPLT
jgi:hypothetical protein